MEELFEMFKGFIIVHDKYSGVVCGYKDTAFILAVESHNKDFFRVLQKDCYILEEYKGAQYRYVYENESEIIKQMTNAGTKIPIHRSTKGTSL